MGLVLFAWKRQYLFAATVFSIPFFNTSVLYFVPLSFFLRTPFFLLALYVGRLLLDTTVCPSNGFRIYRSLENRWLVIWLALSSISLLASIRLSGNVLVHPIEGPAIPEWCLFNFTAFNVTQLTYWLFFGLVFLGLATVIRSMRNIKQVIRWITIASLVVLASGLFAQALFSLGHDKLVIKVFRFFGASSIDHRSIGSLPRMYSLTGEPGYTGFLLAFSLGLILIPVITKKDEWLWSRRANICVVGLLMMGVILSTGTSGYLELAILAMASFVFLLLQQKPDMFTFNIIKWGGISAVLVAVVILLFNGIWGISFVDLLRRTQVEKLLGKYQSGPVRLQFISDAMSIALRYPLLGVGVGANKAYALIPALLSNIGFLGTGAFVMFNGTILWKALRVFKTTHSAEIRSISSALIVTFVGMFGVMSLGKSLVSLIYPYYWLLLALMVALYRVERGYKRHARCTSQALDNKN